MPNIRFLPQDIVISAKPGLPLLDAAARAGILLAADCGGQGVCGRCAVKVAAGRLPGDGGDALSPALREKGYALACQSVCGHDDLVLQTDVSLSGEGQFVETAPPSGVDVLAPPTGAPGGLLPLASLVALRVDKPGIEDGLSDADRLLRALARALPGSSPVFTLEALRGLAAALRQDEGRVTAAVCLRENAGRILAVLPGHAPRPCLGAAVDLGTTTVAVSLADLTQGRILAEKSAYNGQISRGLDVISRINYAARPRRLEELRELALGTINALITDCAREAGRDVRDVYAVSLAGNTVMSHLLLGLAPEHIRLSPYTPTVRVFPALTAREAGLAAHPEAEAVLAPCVGSYVGGDIVAGLLSTGMGKAPGKSLAEGEVELFLDIGTNGELAVGGTDFIMTCACSAGPAFEGGGISCGMPARAGAVERAALSPDGSGLVLSVIGGGKPAGICGSGMISLMAALFRAGILDPAGKFDASAAPPGMRTRIRREGRRAVFVLASREEAAPAAGGEGEELVISETDVENCIRAKAAIYCACDLLLTHIGLGFEDISRFYIAGGFGRFLDIADATTIGLLPDIGREKFLYLGNASLTGARAALFDKKKRRRMLELAESMTYAELMSSPEYMDGYVAALFLPHTDAGRFPSVKTGK